MTYYTSDHLPDFTQSELESMRKAARWNTLTRNLGLSELHKVIIAELLCDERLVTLSTLSIITGYDRKTIRELLTRGVAGGLMRYCPQWGYCITDKARHILVGIYRETREIASGDQLEYTPQLRKAMQDYNEDVGRVCFKGIDY